MAQKQTLVADIESFITESEDRMLAVMRGSLRDMIEDMQKKRADGGRMRVDTGFLRASGRGALDGWPSGNGQKPADAPTGQYTGVYDNWEGSSLNVVLLDMKLGDTFYWGWVANYAPTREVYDGFMDAPIQNWQGYVNKRVEVYRGR